jgi:hypothetical protein
VMLKFDFSGLNTSSEQDFTISFYDKIRDALLRCIEIYRTCVSQYR